MNLIKTFFISSVILLLVSCGAGQKEKIAGKWQLTNFSNDGKKIELTPCDEKTVWDFTTKQAAPLSDGTAVQKLLGKAPADCQYYSFDSNWMVTDGKVFISSCRIGGMGGMSLAGLMEIIELTDNKLVLSTMDKEITLQRK